MTTKTAVSGYREGGTGWVGNHRSRPRWTSQVWRAKVQSRPRSADHHNHSPQRDEAKEPDSEEE